MHAARSPEADTILAFWFGDGLTLGWPSSSRAELWFGGGAELDRQISERFGALVHSAVEGGLTDWEDQPADRLALILLLDQFTRNVFRGQARAFEGDKRACHLSLDALARHWERELPLVGQAFLAMPLMHAESLPMQDLCVAQFERLVAEAPPDVRERLQANLDAAREHRAIVARFGRYPHRNAVLGRASTRDEQDWLRNGKRFGQ